ncbi:hypothetical protein CGRA01v4_11809 [Colletotrichum graminicola]|nr:hypothetical protein CGRA01v4_11809 [Colletotrichum graminicola]
MQKPIAIGAFAAPPPLLGIPATGCPLAMYRDGPTYPMLCALRSALLLSNSMQRRSLQTPYGVFVLCDALHHISPHGGGLNPLPLGFHAAPSVLPCDRDLIR